jgi:hypothetical protein
VVGISFGPYLYTTVLHALARDFSFAITFWMKISVLLIVWVIVNWFYYIVIEAVYEGQHTLAVQKNLRLGMVLFIVSEVMFFFSFF